MGEFLISYLICNSNGRESPFMQALWKNVMNKNPEICRDPAARLLKLEGIMGSRVKQL